MRNTVKKLLAAALAAVLCLSLTACYSENNSWAARKGDDTLPIGAYIYFLNSAYSEAADKVSSDQEVLKADIDGATGKQWTLDRAENYLRSYYYLSEKAEEMGVGLTEEDLESAAASTDSMWTYYKTTLEGMGIAKESFNKAYSVYNTLYEKVFDKIYAEGGDLEVPEDELKAYFTENYYSYDYFYVSLSTTDEDGNSVDMSDDEKASVKESLDAYAAQINAGRLTVEEAATEYAEVALGGEENSTYYAPSPILKDNASETIKTALEDAQEGEAVVADASTGYYLLRRKAIADTFDEIKDDEDQVESILGNMKAKDFQEYVIQQGAQEEGVEINAGALKTVSLSKLVTDDNKMGTVSEAEDEEDSVSSEAESEAE